MVADPAVAESVKVVTPMKVPPPAFVMETGPAEARLTYRSSLVAVPRTVTGPVPSPVPAAFCTIRMPSATVVPPVYVLAPESVSVPVPTLINDPPVAPLKPPSRMMPENVVLRLLVPTRRKWLPRLTMPPPSMDPIPMPAALSRLMSSPPANSPPTPSTMARAVPPSLLSRKMRLPPAAEENALLSA